MNIKSNVIKAKPKEIGNPLNKTKSIKTKIKKDSRSKNKILPPS